MTDDIEVNDFATEYAKSKSWKFRFWIVVAGVAGVATTIGAFVLWDTNVDRQATWQYNLFNSVYASFETTYEEKDSIFFKKLKATQEETDPSACIPAEIVAHANRTEENMDRVSQFITLGLGAELKRRNSDESRVQRLLAAKEKIRSVREELALIKGFYVSGWPTVCS